MVEYEQATEWHRKWRAVTAAIVAGTESAVITSSASKIAAQRTIGGSIMKRSSTVRLFLAGMLVIFGLSAATPAAQSQPAMAVTVGLGGEVDSLDLVAGGVGTAVGTSIYEALFDKLVKINPTNGELQPGLATSWRLADPQTYVLVLRRGVRFHNGEEFDAESAKFTLELVIKSKSFLQSRIPFVDRIDVVDRYTVRIHSSRPDILLPVGLGDIPMYPHRYYQRVGTSGFATQPVGTGPFKFGRWDKGVRIVLERNENYWGKKPQLQTLTFRPFVESATRIAALEAGEIDIAVNVPPDDAQRLQRRGFRIAWTPIGQSMVMLFNLRVESPLRDRRVRQALNYAIDKEALVKNVMLGFGKVLDAQLVGSDGFGYNPELKPYAFDLQRARQLLAEAGFPNGFTIKMETSEGRYVKQREVSEALVGQLARAGIRVQMDVLEWATYVTKLLRTLDVAPLAYVGWNYFPAMDSDFVLRHYATESPYKLFSNARFDDLYNRSRAEADRNKRRGILRDLHAVLREEAPVVFLFQAPNVFALNARVQGFQPTPDDRIHFDNVSVSR